MNATTLREMLTRAAGAPADALVDQLLDVLEAAEKVYHPCNCPKMPLRTKCSGCELKAAIAALYRRAGEVIS